MKDAIKHYGWPLVAVLALWFVFAVLAHDARADWSAAAGTNEYLEVRYDDEMWGAWAAATTGKPRAGVEVHKEYGRVLFGLGAVVAEPDHVVGSTLRYGLRVEFNVNKHFSLGWIHESNCRHICKEWPLSMLPHGSGKQPNEGHNFFVLRGRW